jgi:hypothetical protein
LERRCQTSGKKVESLHHQSTKNGNPIVVEDDTKSGTSVAPTVEELMKKLEKLNAKLKKLKTKDKKGKKYSSSSKDGDSSFEEEVFDIRRNERKKHDKSSYNSISFNYNDMPSSTAYTSVPIGKAPYFDGSNYN